MTETQDASQGRVTVAIATNGRRAILSDTLAHLETLGERPDAVVLSIAEEADVDRAVLLDLPFPVEVIAGPKGSCAQRNRVLERSNGSGILLFLDDDFLIAEGYIPALRSLFAQHPDVVMATGRVLADGVHGPGLSHAEGLAILARAPVPPGKPQPEDSYSVYGCNMAFRAQAFRDHPERFDEDLPLYAWLEDMDLSRRMARFGRVVRDASLIGVHLGTKAGKSPGLHFGYSQIANPAYLIRKGSVRPAPVVKLACRNLAANLVKSLRPEPWIDRRGRLRGNLLALADLIRGRSAPGRILEIA